MTVHEYIEAIQNAGSSAEVINLWTDIARQKNLTLNDIIIVHRSCGSIVHSAMIEVSAGRETELSKVKI